MGVVEIVAGIAGIATAVFGLVKLAIWIGTVSEESKKESIDTDVSKEEAVGVQTGRPPK